MKPQSFLLGWLIFLSPFDIHGAEIVITDTDGALGRTQAPVVAPVQLSRNELRAAAAGRLQLRELRPGSAGESAVIPVQLFTPEQGGGAQLCWLMPPGPTGQRRFRLEKVRQSPLPVLSAKPVSGSGQFDVTDAGQPVLRYNYETIAPGDAMTNVTPANRIYARARSDYIHPLFGLDGEQLTRDWSVDHPHHRGIYWAWPEVDWHSQRGDLHALQKVFARPIGKCSAVAGPVFAQITAENGWQWDNGETVVREQAVIRAYRATDEGRMVDLEFQFEAVRDPVSLARRGTDKYGGLNIRLASVKDQVISFHLDATNTAVPVAWAELSGRFGDAVRPSGLVVLQHFANPDYPGEWVKFPELNWFQPTFPASGTRYELRQGKPLVLRFRLCLHRGTELNDETRAALWRAYQAFSSHAPQ